MIDGRHTFYTIIECKAPFGLERWAVLVIKFVDRNVYYGTDIYRRNKVCNCFPVDYCYVYTFIRFIGYHRHTLENGPTISK